MAQGRLRIALFMTYNDFGSGFQKKIRDILHDNIDQSIDIPLLTQELDISESHLHALFKKEYGITPKKYLQSLRLPLKQQ